MVRGLYTAYTGMTAQQKKMDVVSNNLANASTSGFKQDSVVFKSFDEVFAIKINDPDATGNRNIGEMTLGVSVDEVYTNFEQGSLNLTGNPNNLGIEGEGMFTVGTINEDGTFNEVYTRDGFMSTDANGNLVTKEGLYFMGEQGIITVPNGDVAVTQDGSIFVDNQRIDQIQMTGFEDYTYLKKIGDNNYEMTEAAAKKDFVGAVRQSYEEDSNVNSVKEMVEMITLQRTYEANQKVLTTYDQTLDKAVNSLGRI